MAVTFALTPGEPAAIEAQMAELQRRRVEKQPLNQPSAGSTFKRPVGGFAAALIDQCGLKGASVGGASVCQGNPNLVKTSPYCSSADVARLVALIQEQVRARIGVELESELTVW